MPALVTGDRYDAASRLDRDPALLPHPFYAPLHWVCAVNPGEQTKATLAARLGDAHSLAKHRYDKQQSRHG